MVVLGLTGGTATGKSTVADILAQMGAHVVDADQVARELQQPRSDALKEIAQIFGNGVINADGSLNRRALGRICFSERPQLERLNAIMFPRIRARIESIIAGLKASNQQACLDQNGRGCVDRRVAAVVIDAAILYDAGLDRLADKVIAVVADPEIQLQRLIARTGLSMEEASQRIAAQRPLSEYAQRADYVIDTTAGFESYDRQVRDLYAKILRDHRS